MNELLNFYFEAYKHVIDAGYEYEVTWCTHIKFENTTIDDFFREYVWCVLNAGMREHAARSIFEKYMDTMDTNVIRHDGKRKAIEHVLDNCKMYYEQLINMDNKVDWFATLPWIGQITKYHLARNLGIDAVKPDRHLVRLAKRFNYATPLEMCEAIKNEINERLGAIDVVLWRYCNLQPNITSSSKMSAPTIQSYCETDDIDSNK